MKSKQRILFGQLLNLIAEGLDSGTESLGWLMLYLVCALCLTEKKDTICFAKSLVDE